MTIRPAHIVNLAKSGDDTVFKMRRVHTTQRQINRINEGVQLTPMHWNVLRNFYSETLATPLTLNQVKMIMDLHPKAMIHLADGCIGDTDVDDVLLNALSQFVLGCDWPTGNDHLSQEEQTLFVETLRREFSLLNFKGTPVKGL